MSILNGSISNQPLLGYQYSLVSLSLGQFWFDQFWIVQFSIAHLAFSNFTQSPAPWSAISPVIGQIWPQGVGSGRVEASPLPLGRGFGWVRPNCNMYNSKMPHKQWTIHNWPMPYWPINNKHSLCISVMWNNISHIISFTLQYHQSHMMQCNITMKVSYSF